MINNKYLIKIKNELEEKYIPKIKNENMTYIQAVEIYNQACDKAIQFLDETELNDSEMKEAFITLLDSKLVVYRKKGYKTEDKFKEENNNSNQTLKVDNENQKLAKQSFWKWPVRILLTSAISFPVSYILSKIFTNYDINLIFTIIFIVLLFIFMKKEGLKNIILFFAIFFGLIGLFYFIDNNLSEDEIILTDETENSGNDRIEFLKNLEKSDETDLTPVELMNAIYKDCVNYEYDSYSHLGDYWQDPHVTLITKQGDCEDYTLLLMVMFRLYYGISPNMYIVKGDDSYHAMAEWEDILYDLTWNESYPAWVFYKENPEYSFYKKLSYDEAIEKIEPMND